MSQPRVVDVHSHLSPESFPAAGLLPPYSFDVAALLGQRAEAGVDISLEEGPGKDAILGGNAARIFRL